VAADPVAGSNVETTTAQIRINNLSSLQVSLTVTIGFMIEFFKLLQSELFESGLSFKIGLSGYAACMGGLLNRLFVKASEVREADESRA
jgi:hypothetical protein